MKSDEIEVKYEGEGNAYEVRVTRLSVAPRGESLFSELCTHVSIVDEAAGEFVEIEQQAGGLDVKKQTISVNEGEWQAIRSAVDRLFKEIAENLDRNQECGI